MTSHAKDGLGKAFPLLAVLAAVLFAYWMSLAPRPVSASSPPELFSAERAHEHIAANCTEPQPAGSLNNDRACRYIQDELERMGVENELVIRYVNTGGRTVARWRAVLGRIRGTAPTKAFAVDAHFDSVPWGPGAADDFSGIAAMLESARALKAGPPLKNDVIFVFADQEEFNMGGAKAFQNHPWFQEVGVMLGLETRGSSGPALMFETSSNNGFVVREMARSRAGARANSTMYDFYKRMPFNSDFDHYKRHVAGLNVAYVNNFDCYHTMLDNPDNISLGSLQHHGDYVLGLARHFGGIPLDDCYAPDVTYFNTIGNHMIVYPISWGWPLAVITWIFVVAVLGFGFASRRLRIGGTLLGLCSTPLAILATSPLIGLVSYIFYLRFYETALYQNNVYALGFNLLAIAALCAFVALLRNRVQPREFLAGGVIWWTLALLAMQWWIPGGTHLAMIPALLGSLCLLALCAKQEASEKAVAWAVLLVIPAFMLVAPLLVMAAYTLTVMASFMLAPIALVLCALVAPQLRLISRSGLFKTAGALACVGVALIIAGYVGTLPSPSSPRIHCLAYGVDFDKGEAYWLSGDKELDEWTSLYIPEGTPRQRLDEFLGRDRHEYFRAPAPMPPYGKPMLEIKADRIEDGRRILDCRLNSPRDAQRIWLNAESGEVYRAEVLGIDLPGDKNRWGAFFQILPREGADIRFEVMPDVPLRFLVREESYGLPELPELKPRPAHMIPEPNRRLDRSRSLHSDLTYSVATIDLGARPAQ